ncbi:two-component system, chemotaxis family, sensor kinase CheA [Candidatus Magnetomoraceae bacterium gMMP-1]
MDFQDDELIQSFVVECCDMLDEAEPHLIELSQGDDGGTEEIINVIFRLFHSIKGSASFLKFKDLTSVTHEAETLLQVIRDGGAKISSQHTELFMNSCDIVREMLDNIENSGSDEGFEEKVESITVKLKNAIQEGKCPSLPSDKIEQEPVPESSNDSNNEIDSNEKIVDPQEIEISPEIRQLFIQESTELLDSAEQAFLKFDKAPNNIDELIGQIFRSIHSFKGSCGLLGFTDLENLNHKLETVLEAVKDEKIECHESNVDFFLNIIDILKKSVEDIESGGAGNIQGVEMISDLVEDMIPKSQKKDNELNDHIAKITEESDIIKSKAPEESPAKTMPEPVDQPKIKSPEKKPVIQKKSKGKKPSAPSKISARGSAIRVDLAKLDTLINLVGELVIAEAMVIKNPDLEGYELESFDRAARHLNRIVRDLQDISMSVRMIPISATFRKMIRLVHDVSSKAHKKAKIVLSGEDTEVDKTVAELIADPLVHLIRNAVDHGIEPSDERLSSGKEETGTVNLEARHESGEIWILIKDDGRGLDREKILAKGIENGLVEGDGQQMSDDEVFKLIFEPGFSTADKVTDISGRGVGMDVVKKNIEKLKGRVDIHSKIGSGSTMIIRIPLTLSIIDGMLVRVGKARYTIPMLSIRESIQIDTDRIVKTMDGQEVVKLRDGLYTVLRLYEIYNLEADYKELDKGLLIVIQEHSESICLLVDEILGQHQAVIKGLSNYIFSIRDVRGVSGCTILGDGEISLILDVRGLIEIAQKKTKN